MLWSKIKMNNFYQFDIKIVIVSVYSDKSLSVTLKAKFNWFEKAYIIEL